MEARRARRGSSAFARAARAKGARAGRELVGDTDARSAATRDGVRVELRDVPAWSFARAVRVYGVPAANARRVGRYVRRVLTDLETLERVRADPCRPELLVEIEALANAAP